MFFGLAAIGYEAGIVGYLIGLGYAIGLLMFSKLSARIKPLMDGNNCDTLDDYIRSRFGSKAHGAVTLLNLVFFLAVLAAQFVAVASLVSIFHESLHYSVILSITALSTILYTMSSGHKGVIFTDRLQIFFILVAAIIVFGDLLNLTDLNSTLSINVEGYYTGTAYGVAFLIGTLLFFPFTVICRSDLWQRIASAKDARTIERSIKATIPPLMVFYFLFTTIGIFSRSITSDAINPETSGLEVFVENLTSGTFPSIVQYTLLGIVIIGILSALFSTIDTNLNVVSVAVSKFVFSRSFYIDHERNSINKIRVVVLALGFLGLAFSIMLPDIVDLIVGAGTVLLILLPSILDSIYSEVKISHIPGVLSIIGGLLVFLVFFIFITTKTAFIPATAIAFLLFYISKAINSKKQNEFRNS